MNSNHKLIIKVLTWVIFVIYLIFLVYFLFFSERYGRTVSDNYKYNLTPFSEIKRYFKYYDIIGFEDFFINIIGNVIAFIPFGLCIPIIHAQYRQLGLVLLDGFIFTVCIETVQLMLKVGSFDVDDIMLNTVGAVAGYYIYRLIYYIYRRINKKGGVSEEVKEKCK